MGRYIKDAQLDQPLDVVSLVMEDYIYHERFSRTDWNGEMVFYRKDGHGRERYMKWSYAGGLFHVEAWLKNPLGGEMDLDGVGGGASRREFRESMDRLLRTLKDQSSSNLAGGHVGADPLHHSSNYEAEHRAWQDQNRNQSMNQDQNRDQSMNQGLDRNQSMNQGRGPNGSQGQSGQQPQRLNTNRSSLRTAVFFAIAGILFAGFIPLAGIIFGIWGLKKSGDCDESTARAVKGVCIVVIAISIIRWIISFVLGFLGFALLGL